jgi:hypothetical protein
VGFVLFLLVTAVLFIRPAEIVPALASVPIYNILMLACLAAAGPRVLARLQGRPLAEQPITACVLAVLAAGVLSHLSRFNLHDARTHGLDLAKVVIYYLLLVGLVDTPGRLRTFLRLLVGFSGVLVALAILHYHGRVSIPSLEALERWGVDEETGEAVSFLQLRSTGIFNDPNDLCVILSVALAAALYFLADRRSGPLRLLWLAPLGGFAYGIVLTRSRGGFIALVAALAALLYARFGRTRATLLGLLLLPALLVVFGGRQTDISTEDATAQSRIQVWAEGLVLFQQDPLFGVGMNYYFEEVGHVAHNSYIHCFTELGFLGGAAFFGAFYLAVRSLYRLGAHRDQVPDPELGRLRPYLLAMVVAQAVGMLTISRAYEVPTYMVLGLAAAYLQSLTPVELTGLRLDSRLAFRVAAASLAFLAGAHAFVRLFADWG